MAFRRTFAAFAGKDVHPALTKLWKKYHKVDGQVTQHLSPFEQNIVTPMLKDMPSKIFKRAKEFLFEAGPGLAAGIAVFYWGEHEFHAISYRHRS